MSVNDKIRVSTQHALAVGAGAADALRVSDLHAMAIGGQTAPYVFVHEGGALAIGTDGGAATMLRVHDQHIMIIASEGLAPNTPLRVSAFGYDIDGHVMYGLHVRNRGTFLYDITTGQWSRWETADFNFWNAHYHVKWRDQFYASSLIENQLVRIDPDSVLDDSFRTNRFTATGRLERQEREYIQNSEAQIFGSIGISGGEVNLRYSDDDGANWSNYRTVTVEPGARSTNVMFYDLGSVTAPGRIYQIEDDGTLRRIHTLKVMLGSMT